MPDSATAPAPTVAELSTEYTCSWADCQQPARYAIRFHNQGGHVHDCPRHTAFLREYADVAEVAELPCPFPHGGIWTETPREFDPWGRDD